MKDLKLEEYFCANENVENKVKEIAKKQNIDLNTCIIDLIGKAYRSQTIFDKNIYGVVGEREYKMLIEYFVNKKCYTLIAKENNVSVTRIRQLVAKGCKNMRARLQIFLNKNT